MVHVFETKIKEMWEEQDHVEVREKTRNMEFVNVNSNNMYTRNKSVKNVHQVLPKK